MNYDTNEQVLREIRRLRRGCEIAYGILIIVFAVVGLVIYAAGKAKVQGAKSPPDSWGVVRSAMDQFDYDKAYDVAQRIVTRYPSNYFGHTYLGSISIATGRFQDAERHYSRAHELFPSEENEKTLFAVRKRLESATGDYKTAGRKTSH